MRKQVLGLGFRYEKGRSFELVAKGTESKLYAMLNKFMKEN